MKPESTVRLVWDFLILFLVCCSMLYTPLSQCFQFDYMKDSFVSYFDEILVLFFIIDIFISCFLTGYYSKGVLILNPNKIAKHYINTIFLWDFLSLFPYFLSVILKIEDLKIALLLRVFKMAKIFDKLEEHLHLSDKPKGIYEISKLALKIIYVGHFFACFWVYIANIEESYGIMNNWLRTFHLDTSEWTSKYISSLYFTVYTMVTVGYGDIYPSNITEKICCIVLMILACGVFAYSLNRFGDIMQEMNKRDNDFLL